MDIHNMKQTREELAREYCHEHPLIEADIDAIRTRLIDWQRTFYLDGFDAGYSTAKLEAEELVKALEGLLSSRALEEAPFYKYCESVDNATAALARYRGERE